MPKTYTSYRKAIEAECSKPYAHFFVARNGVGKEYEMTKTSEKEIPVKDFEALSADFERHICKEETELQEMWMRWWALQAPANGTVN